MAGVPTNFVSSPKPFANYSYDDIAAGTGYVDFNGFSTQTSGAILYCLGEQSPFQKSDGVGGLYVSADLLNGAGTQTSKTFKTSVFNVPRIIRGTIYINFTWAPYDASSSADYIIVEVQKNTTTLASASTPMIQTATTTLLPIEIPTTLFQNGDYLAVKFNAYGTANHTMIYFDPLNRDYDATGGYIYDTSITAADNSTKMVVSVPFRIDLN